MNTHKLSDAEILVSWYIEKALEAVSVLEPSRATSLVTTKLQEAEMWLRYA